MKKVLLALFLSVSLLLTNAVGFHFHGPKDAVEVGEELSAQDHEDHQHDSDDSHHSDDQAQELANADMQNHSHAYDGSIYKISTWLPTEIREVNIMPISFMASDPGKPLLEPPILA